MTTDLEREPLLTRQITTESDKSHQREENDASSAESGEPITWQSESKIIARDTLPLIGTYLLQYFYNLVIVFVCSRLSTEELAAVALGITTSNIVGYAVFEGMATALDTLCAQAYGSGDVQLVGLHVLRFLIYIHLVALPICILWIFSGQILPYLVPSNELARYGSEFLRWSVIGVPGYATFEAGKRFMQAQNNFTSGLMVLVACLPLNVFLNWLLVFHFDLRIAGAALAAALTNLVRPILLIGYALIVNRKTLQCWPDPFESKSLWVNWKPMVNLSIPGAVMTLSEWMAFEILTFATSYAGTVALAAQTFLATTTVVVWHIPFAGSVVTSTRLGQLIGAGHRESAKRVSEYYVYMFALEGAVQMLMVYALLEIIVQYLEIEQAVRVAILEALPYGVVFTYFDCMATCMHGIIRGIGWQSIGGWVTVLCNYLYGVPLSLVLELGPPDLGIRGLWMALATCLAMVAIVEGLVVKLKSWEGVAALGSER